MPALGNCQRCGTFFCAADRLDVDSVAYCQPCGIRPDVDWIEAYRQSLLGRRDGWAWLFGLTAIGYIAFSANLAANTDGTTRLLAVPALGSAIVGALFFFGKPIARWLLVVSTVFWAVVQFALIGPWSLLPGLVSALFVTAVLINTRNRLFFRLEVSREAVRKDYDRLADNRIARNAFALGILSLLLPFIAPIAIICGVIGFKRVNPTAKPPVGKGAHAIAGIVFGALGIVVGALWITFRLNLQNN